MQRARSTQPPAFVQSCSLAHRDTFHIVAAYEDYTAGRRAREVGTRLVAELGSGFEVTCEFWRFDCLLPPALGDYARADAARADLIIVSCRSDSPLPEHVQS